MIHEDRLNVYHLKQRWLETWSPIPLTLYGFVVLANWFVRNSRLENGFRKEYVDKQAQFSSYFAVDLTWPNPQVLSYPPGGKVSMPKIGRVLEKQFSEIAGFDLVQWAAVG